MQKAVSNLDSPPEAQPIFKNVTRRPPVAFGKRAQSASPVQRPRFQSPAQGKKNNESGERRCQSLSPSTEMSKKSICKSKTHDVRSAPVVSTNHETQNASENDEALNKLIKDKNGPLPQFIITKLIRNLATRKRDLLKLRKNVISQQNQLLETLAAVRELEQQIGCKSDDTFGEVRFLTMNNWPANDLLMLLRDNYKPASAHIDSIFGPQVMQQIQGQLCAIPDEVHTLATELMTRRMEVLMMLRNKHRMDRSTYNTNLEWKTRNAEFDKETEQLNMMITGTIKNLNAKINNTVDLAKVPWIDRDGMVKKIEKLKKEILVLQHKVEEASKIEEPPTKDVGKKTNSVQDLSEELKKEKAAREALREVVKSAESMLRVARARISTLERQLKDTRADLETSQRKQKDLEQLCRHRESSFDARSKKFMEVSKTGELTIDVLSRQRDALEMRVKELREQAEAAEAQAETRLAEIKAHADSLQEKVAEQEKELAAAQRHAEQMQSKVIEIEQVSNLLRMKSAKLVELEHQRCLEFIPSRESEPTDRETEIWKELQVTRVALAKAEEELRKSRADKESFLNSLSRIAQGEGNDNREDKMATELLDREQKIMRLQQKIEELTENEKLMEQSMTDYENQLADLRMEVKKLRNYDYYTKDTPYQELQTELMEMSMKVKTLSRERSALVNAATSRALMLERHERSAELFAKMMRVRRELAAALEGRPETPPAGETAQVEVSRSLSCVSALAADTWSALRVERSRVVSLERAVLSQSLQLEREERVRTQLERRRAYLERAYLRSHANPISDAYNGYPVPSIFMKTDRVPGAFMKTDCVKRNCW